MSGLGRKVFTAGEVLAAADVNGYLMDQSVMVFANAAARTAAISSPAAGMMTFLVDVAAVNVYDGSAWVEVSGGGGVTVSATAPASPDDGDLWLDSTDGSMYVYYTDPGGANAQWIGAVSRSGGILQVVSTTKTDTFSASTATGAFTSNITGLEATITPRSTSSKILVQVSVDGSASTNYGVAHLQLQRDGSPVGVGDAAGSRSRITAQAVSNTNNSNDVGNANKTFLDSPNTTSSITYGVKLHNETSSTQTLYVNRSSVDSDLVRKGRSISTITLMEVAG